jgi:hypothetical protein
LENGLNNKLDSREANKEYFDLNEPEYYVAMKKWYVSIRYDEHFYLHNDATIQFGTFTEFVPGDKRFTALYDTKKEATKVIKRYNLRWAMEQNNINIDEELAKELARVV